MYEFISGKIAMKNPAQVVLDNHGIGYQVKTSLSTSKALPDVGQEATIVLYLHVREDALQLYGFSTKEERELFLGLISVSGIGPKLALTILSGLTAEQFVTAIHRADEKSLNSISGVGKKTAQRLIIELKGKLPDMQIESEAVPPEQNGLTLSSLESEALMALVSLGYSRIQAQKAIQKVQNKEPQIIAEELIKKALQVV